MDRQRADELSDADIDEDEEDAIGTEAGQSERKMEVDRLSRNDDSE